MWILLIGLPLVLGLFGIMVSAQIYRYLRVSGPIERQQTKWVVFGLTVAIVMSFGVSWLGELFPMLNRPGAPRIVYVLTQQTLNDISLLLIPLTITVAILKFRLWDIDLIINRTIVYGSLSAVLAAVFVLTDTLLLPLLVQSVLGKDNPSLNAVVAALIIAVLFEPLRRRIKEGVDRLTDWLAGSHSTGEPPR